MNCIYMEKPPFGRDWTDIGAFQPNFTLYIPLLEMVVVSGAATCLNDKGRYFTMVLFALIDGVLAKTGEWNEYPKYKISNTANINNIDVVRILHWHVNKL